MSRQFTITGMNRNNEKSFFREEAGILKSTKSGLLSNVFSISKADLTIMDL